jgi:vanillate/3-O-methylgallate O-demethylase
VRSRDGELIGMSQYCAYTANERDLISVSCIDEEHAGIGSEVVITWGEADGGSRKPHVERHTQTTIRAIVCEAPYGRVARDLKQASLSGPPATSGAERA